MDSKVRFSASWAIDDLAAVEVGNVFNLTDIVWGCTDTFDILTAGYVDYATAQICRGTLILAQDDC